MALVWARLPRTSKWSFSTSEGKPRRSVQAGLAESMHLAPAIRHSAKNATEPAPDHVFLIDVQDQRHVVAMRQPVFGSP
jgi:hypothetical protein